VFFIKLDRGVHFSSLFINVFIVPEHVGSQISERDFTDENKRLAGVPNKKKDRDGPDPLPFFA
ncbi:hypothetical protein, partial [Turicimonas muris]|uniref:hypothetical protein n=1 Tax=Turicimonas muris TaxID=1796652 RepID=UPI0026EA6AC3